MKLLDSRFLFIYKKKIKESSRRIDKVAVCKQVFKLVIKDLLSLVQIDIHYSSPVHRKTTILFYI